MSLTQRPSFLISISWLLVAVGFGIALVFKLTFSEIGAFIVESKKSVPPIFQWFMLRAWIWFLLPIPPLMLALWLGFYPERNLFFRKSAKFCLSICLLFELAAVLIAVFFIHQSMLKAGFLLRIVPTY